MHYGSWTADQAFLMQYNWADSTPLLNTSTAQLRSLQPCHGMSAHMALTKWELALEQPIPKNIWSSIWISYRGASENTFLWQLLYRVIATQKWRFPTTPATYPCTWCTRCTAGLKEYLTHCIWSCSISIQCWQWGEFLLQAISPHSRPLSSCALLTFSLLPLFQRIGSSLTNCGKF